MEIVQKSHGMFTPDLHWRVYLSNDEVIFYDHRQDLEPKSSWLRLKEYVNKNSLKINRIQIVFRSHVVEFPAVEAKAYFHIQAIGATMSLQGCGSFGESDDMIWKFGYLDNESNEVVCIWYRVPEIEVINVEKRTIESCGISLIRN